MIKTLKQKRICKKYGADFVPTASHLKLGIAENVDQGLLPINGLRILPNEGTSGWFIWAGEEWSDADDFFLPYHAEHLAEWAWADTITKYLGLAPGWRFLVAGDYEDVWFDEELLNELPD